MTNNITLEEKIRLLKIDLDNDNEEYINKLFDIYKNKDKINIIIELIDKPVNEKIIVVEKQSEKPKKNINKKTGKYVILLKLLNKILTNLSKNNITDLTEFQNIDRDDIIKEENVNCYDELENEIFEYFDKAKCGWYRRNRTKNYLLTFLRVACENIGLKFSYIQKNRAKNSLVKTHIYYSII